MSKLIEQLREQYKTNSEVKKRIDKFVGEENGK